MLLPFEPCSFNNNVDINAIKHLRSLSSREKDRGCTGFGGWLAPARKRKTKSRKGSVESDVKPAITNKQNVRMIKNDSYYKRYRVDPLEGTFKHYKNSSQYIKLYRETTTLCYKQKTLNELSSMYSAALDVHSGDKSTITGCYNLDPDVCARTWGTGNEGPTQLDVAFFMKEHQINIPPIKEQCQQDPNVPLMLLPTAPSIPRLHQGTCSQSSTSQIAPTAFMCNAYLNRNTVCPVHRLIHRRNIILNTRASVINSTMEHIKVELPGIPKRRWRVEAAQPPADPGGSPTPTHSPHSRRQLADSVVIKRLKTLQSINEADSILGSSSHSAVELQLKRDIDAGVRCASIPKTATAPPSIATILDEDEDTNNLRIDHLLGSNIPASPSDKISKALSQKRSGVASLQLPITALLQYSHSGQQVEHHRRAKIKKPLRTKLIRRKTLKIPSDVKLNRPEIKQSESQWAELNGQSLPRVYECKKPKTLSPLHFWRHNKKLVSYEKQYERYFSDILESKGRASQKKHHQNLSNNK